MSRHDVSAGGNSRFAAAISMLVGVLAVVVVAFLVTPSPAVADESPEGAEGKYRRGVETGDPIWAGSGAFGFRLPFLRFGGPLPLEITLSYNSDNGVVGTPYIGPPFELGGFPRLDKFGTPGGSEVEIQGVREGQFIRFDTTGSSGTWTLAEPAEVRYVLTETASYFYFLDPIAERVYFFEKNINSLAPDQVRVRGFQDRNGNRWTYSYPTASASSPSQLDDGLGRSLVFTYTSQGTLSRAVDHGGRTISFTIVTDPSFGPILRSVADPLGQTSAFSYDPTATWAVTAITTPRGTVQFRQTYSMTRLAGRTDTRVTAQTDAYGNRTTLAYDPVVNRVTETTPISTVIVYSHRGNDGAPQVITDATARTAGFTSDARREVTAVTDRVGNTTGITYHLASGKLAGITNARGGTTAFSYTAQDQAFVNPFMVTETITFTFYNLTRIDYPDGSYEQLTYDGKGNLLTRVDRAGSISRYDYNSRGQVLTATLPTGGIITSAYNADGTLASTGTSETGATTYGYDVYKRLSRVTHPDGTSVQYAYDLTDRLTSVTDERGNTYAFEYDANGNLTRATDPAGNATRYSYDLLDRLSQLTDRLGSTGTFSYDALGRLSGVVDRSGLTTTFGYDPRGWRNQVTRGGQTWQVSYDAEGLASGSTTPSGRQSTARRDALGYLTGLADPLGNTSGITRDAASRVTGFADPLARRTAYAYDGRGLLTGVTPPVSGTATYQYDSLGGLARIADLNGQTWPFTRTALGRLQALGDPLGRTQQHTYDSRGRLSQTTFADGSTATRTYDAASNLTRVLYSDATDLQFGYDALNRITGTTGLQLSYDAEGRVTSTTDGGLTFGATYDAASRLKTATYNNNAFAVTYTYSSTTGLLMRVSDSLAGAAVDFTYDADFQLTGIRRSNGVNATLSWDAASRLTRIQDGTVLDLQYGLDAAGQVVSQTLAVPLDPASALTTSTSTTLGFDAASEVSSSGYSHDARGRQTAAPGQSFSWDGASRLTGAGGATLAYNGFGDLRTRTAGSSTTRFHYSYAIGLTPVVAEQDASSGQVLRTYVWTPDGRLLYGIDAANDNKVFFYHFDRTGSTLAMTDGSGAVSDAYAYDPYGRLLTRSGTSGQPFTFVGELGVRQEGTSGTLYQMRARYYDATTGRFLSRDPIWPWLSDPQQLNPYQYAETDPVSIVDPTGTLIGGGPITEEQIERLTRESQSRQAEQPQSPGLEGYVYDEGTDTFYREERTEVTYIWARVAGEREMRWAKLGERIEYDPSGFGGKKTEWEVRRVPVDPDTDRRLRQQKGLPPKQEPKKVCEQKENCGGITQTTEKQVNRLLLQQSGQGGMVQLTPGTAGRLAAQHSGQPAGGLQPSETGVPGGFRTVDRPLPYEEKRKWIIATQYPPLGPGEFFDPTIGPRLGSPLSSGFDLRGFQPKP